MAGLGAGVWKDREELRKLCQEEKVFSPNMSAEERANKYRRWKKAVQRSMKWAE